MNGFLRKAAISFILLPVFCYSEAATLKKVNFYGVISPDADSNTINITEDLYYRQLEELSLTISDKRSPTFTQNYIDSGTPDFSDADADAFIFYVYIEKSSDKDGKWNSSINVRTSASGETFTYSREYDSYYKILMEAKPAVNSVFSNLIKSEHDTAAGTAAAKPPQTKDISTETIAGTWKGEQYADKIVILRGGRGFIIFNNGASMNINVSVSIDGNGSTRVKVIQSGRPNASFFPELSRKTALETAKDAKPVEWNFVLSENGSLKGTKTTLLQSSPDAPPEEGTIPAEWTRRNQ